MRTKLALISLLFLVICQSGYGQTLDHPRLLVTQDKLSTLWTRANQSGTPAATLWGKLQQRCNNAQQNPPYGNERYYDYRQISMLAFAAQLLRQSSDPDDLVLADSYAYTALSYCQTYILLDDIPKSSGDDHFPVVHRIKALALTFDYLYNEETSIFPDGLKAEFADTMLSDMAYIRLRFEGSCYRFENNHGAFDCAALLFGAIALEGDPLVAGDYSPEDAQSDIQLVKDWMFTNSDSYIRRIFGQDGACVEGLQYGFVNLMHTLPCLQALEVREDTTWFQVSYIRDRLKMVPQWIAYETLPFPETHTDPHDSKAKPIMNILNDTWNYGGLQPWGVAGHDGYDPTEMAIRMLTLSGLYDDQDMGV